MTDENSIALDPVSKAFTELLLDVGHCFSVLDPEAEYHTNLVELAVYVTREAYALDQHWEGIDVYAVALALMDNVLRGTMPVEADCYE